jgi:hypothetical protein
MPKKASKALFFGSKRRSTIVESTPHEEHPAADPLRSVEAAWAWCEQMGFDLNGTSKGLAIKLIFQDEQRRG